MLKSPLMKATIGALLLALAGFVVATFAASGQPLAAQQVSATPSPVPTRRMPGKVGSGEHWIILDLPPNAAQIDYGYEIYRLVCKACHGDVGQGLTPEWRSTWAPEDQNCWQSKCHAPNHPPEGFIMPVAPAINNLTQRSTFPTALQLQAYIHAAMPWYKPGGLTDERAWQVTAYVLKLNNIDAGPVLNTETAAKIRLAPASPRLFKRAVLIWRAMTRRQRQPTVRSEHRAAADW
jgi:mono/diheme cytochrome c family protein